MVEAIGGRLTATGGQEGTARARRRQTVIRPQSVPATPDSGGIGAHSPTRECLLGNGRFPTLTPVLG